MEKKSRANFICLNLVTGVLFMLGMGWGGLKPKTTKLNSDLC